ncbi:DUF2231 domain-containing protein, partial [Escherichia coli]
IHGLMNLGLVALAAMNLILRWRDPEAAVAPFGFILSAICVGLIAITGWLGARWSFGMASASPRRSAIPSVRTPLTMQ